MKRREFFTQSVGAGAASVLGTTVAFADTKAQMTQATGSPAQRMSKAWFETLLDESVLLHQEGQEPIAAKVAAIHVIPGSPKHEQFSVVFRITNGTFQGGLFEVEHAKTGRFLLMVSPGATVRPQQMYMAHFSLLKQQS